LKARDIPVLLAGMYAPRNLGAAYYEEFDAIYPALAEEYDVPLYPFFLDGVAQNSKLNLEDGMHPTGEGIREIVERMLPAVEDFLRRIQAES
jgi:acyl-CoA thioesterase-1